MGTVGVGEITYECRDQRKTPYRSVLSGCSLGPDAVLNDRRDRAVGKYFGPPATWGSRSKGQRRRLRFPPCRQRPAAGQANPATGNGADWRHLHPARGHQRRRGADDRLVMRPARAKRVVKYQAVLHHHLARRCKPRCQQYRPPVRGVRAWSTRYWSCATNVAAVRCDPGNRAVNRQCSARRRPSSPPRRVTRSADERPPAFLDHARLACCPFHV